MKKILLLLIYVFINLNLLFAQDSNIHITNIHAIPIFKDDTINGGYIMDKYTPVILFYLNDLSNCDSVFYLFGNKKDLGDLYFFKGNVFSKENTYFLNLLEADETIIKNRSIESYFNFGDLKEFYKNVNWLTVFVKDKQGRLSNSLYFPYGSEDLAIKRELDKEEFNFYYSNEKFINVNFNLKNPHNVTLDLLSLRGLKIKTLLDSRLKTFNTKIAIEDVSIGIYFLRVSINSEEYIYKVFIN